MIVSSLLIRQFIVFETGVLFLTPSLPAIKGRKIYENWGS